MPRRNDPRFATLQAPADYARLVAHTAPHAALKATLPIDPRSYAALLSLRDDVLAEVYSSILEPA